MECCRTLIDSAVNEAKTRGYGVLARTFAGRYSLRHRAGSFDRDNNRLYPFPLQNVN